MGRVSLVVGPEVRPVVAQDAAFVDWALGRWWGTAWSTEAWIGLDGGGESQVVAVRTPSSFRSLRAEVVSLQGGSGPNDAVRAVLAVLPFEKLRQLVELALRSSERKAGARATRQWSGVTGGFAQVR